MSRNLEPDEDPYWDELAADFNVKRFLATHSSGSGDTFLLISDAGEWNLWSALSTQLAKASRGHSALSYLNFWDEATPMKMFTLRESTREGSPPSSLLWTLKWIAGFH